MAGSSGRQVRKRPTPTDQRGSKVEVDNVVDDSDDDTDDPEDGCQADVGVDASEDDADAGADADADDDNEAVNAARDERSEVAGEDGEGPVVKEMMIMPCATRRQGIASWYSARL